MNSEKSLLQVDSEKLKENLMKINDEFLKAKWYFLATVASVGTAYLKSFNQFFILITSAVGNLIFWMIGEYVISQGFLFRYIQTKLAKVEETFYTEKEELRKLIKDPGKRCNYIKAYGKSYFFLMDYILPDQFLPLYWASFWLIILNTATAIKLYCDPLDFHVFLLLLLSLFLIWKLFEYHLYKIRQFFKGIVNIEISPSCDEKKEFFRFPFSPFYGLFPGVVLCYLSWIFEIKKLPWYYLLIFPIFWQVFLAIIAYLLKIIDTILDRERKLSVKLVEEKKFVVQVSSKIEWAYWLLYFIV